MYNKVIIFIIFILLPSALIFSQEKKKIEILHANTMEYDKNIGDDAKRLLGNVLFKQNDVYMSCDSAYFYSAKNMVDAFNKIKIEQGDTFHLYGDFLHYDGTTRLAQIRNNVVLINKESTLKTDYLDYNLKDQIGYYIDGGDITNGENQLQSEVGFYYSGIKTFFCRNNVVITNPKYVIYSDTMRYNTVSEVSYFLGPTEIKSKENYIYCENGWYNSKSDICQFNKNAYYQSGPQKIKGDSLYYDRKNGLGRAFNNVVITDTSQNVILKGNISNYFETPQRAMMTDSAQMIQFDKGDSSFVHADTLRSNLDSTGIYKVLRAYYHVKIFKNDIQGACDSMSYSFKDSIMHMNGSPVLWTSDYQLTSDYIKIKTRNSQIDTAYMYNSSFIVGQEDSVKYNQVKGRNMAAYFNNNEVYKIDVFGNGQTVYYPKDNNDIIGVNKALSSNITIYVKYNDSIRKREISRIVFITKPEATLYPLKEAPVEELILKGFKWLEDKRPYKKEDIFIW